MDSFNTQNSNNSNYSDVGIPEQLSWENMELGINTKINALKKEKRRRFIFWSIGSIALIAVLVTISIIVITNPKNELLKTALEVADVEKQNLPNPNISVQVLEVETLENPTDVEIMQNKGLSNIEMHVSQSQEKRSPYNSRSSTHKQKISQGIVNTTLNPKAEISSIDAALSMTTHERHKARTEIYIENSFHHIEKQRLENDSIDFVESLPLQAVDFERSINLETLQIESVDTDIADISGNRKIAQFIELNSGILFTSGSFKGNEIGAEKLSSSSFLSAGMSIQVKLGLRLNDKLDFTTALDYLESWYGLEMSHKEVHKVKKDGIVTSRLKNLASGIVRETIGTSNIDSIVTTQVNDFNSDKSLGLKLALARRFHIGSKLVLSPEAGIGISRNLKAQAILIDDENKLHLFDQNSEFLRRYHVSVGAGVAVSYPFFERIDIQLNAHLRRHLTSWYLLDKTRYKPNQYGIALGVRYNFN